MSKTEEFWLPGMEPGANKMSIVSSNKKLIGEREFVVFDFPKIEGVKFSYHQRKKVIFANIDGWGFMCKVFKKSNYDYLEFKDFSLTQENSRFYDDGEEVKKSKVFVEQKLSKIFPKLKKEIEDNINDYRYLFDN